MRWAGPPGWAAAAACTPPARLGDRSSPRAQPEQPIEDPEEEMGRGRDLEAIQIHGVILVPVVKQGVYFWSSNLSWAFA